MPQDGRTFTLEATTELLISQWQDSFFLKGTMEIWLDVLNEFIVQPRNRLQLMRRIDTAEGIWLDYIGERLGIIRPFGSIDLLGDPRFGFDQAGVPFDQGRFLDAIGALNPLTPIGDEGWRRFLKARAITILSRGGIDDYRRAVREIDPDAVVVDNHDMTVSITTTMQGNIEVAERIEAITLPAGVGRIFV